MIRQVLLRGQRTLLERHRLLRAQHYLQEQLQTNVIGDDAERGLPSVRVSLHDWTNPAASPLTYDRLLRSLEQSGDFSLVVCCTDWLIGSQPALELLNRYQRLLPVSERAAVPASWDSVLDAHRRHTPKESYDSGLDVWRWLLRLAEKPSARLQLSALFHEAGKDPLERALLQSARDLSFFNLGSWGYAKERGAAAARAAAHRRLLRMDSGALCLALTTRQPPAVSQAIEDFLTRAEPAQGCVTAHSSTGS